MKLSGVNNLRKLNNKLLKKNKKMAETGICPYCGSEDVEV